MRVDAPRVGALDALHEAPAPAPPRPTARTRRRRAATPRGPRSASAIGAEGVAGARGHVPGLRADDRRPLRPASAAARAVGDHAPLVVGRDAHRRPGAEARAAAGRWRPSRAPARRTRRRPAARRAGRRAPRPSPRAPAPRPGPRPGRSCCALRAGHEADARARRAGRGGPGTQPAATSSIAAAAGEATWKTGALVPGRDEPVRGQRRRERPAEDEAEVARARGGDEPGSAAGGERRRRPPRGPPRARGAARPAPRRPPRRRPRRPPAARRPRPGTRSAVGQGGPQGRVRSDMAGPTVTRAPVALGLPVDPRIRAASATRSTATARAAVRQSRSSSRRPAASTTRASAGAHLAPQALLDLDDVPEVLLLVLDPLEVGDGDAAGVGQDVGDDEDAALAQDRPRPRAWSGRWPPRRSMPAVDAVGVVGGDLALERGRDEDVAGHLQDVRAADGLAAGEAAR